MPLPCPPQRHDVLEHAGPLPRHVQPAQPVLQCLERREYAFPGPLAPTRRPSLIAEYLSQERGQFIGECVPPERERLGVGEEGGERVERRVDVCGEGRVKCSELEARPGGV